MFTLRIIEEIRENTNSPFQQVIENFAVGNSYSILKNGSTKEFDELMKRNYPEKSADELVKLLTEITEGKGRYDMDRLKHAANTIEDMKELAQKAIDLIK